MKKNGDTTLADVVESIKEMGDNLERKLGARIDGVNSRLDGVLRLLGGYHRNHERRITALEKKVFKKIG